MADTLSTIPAQPTFTGIPLEIRREIYRHLLVRPSPVELGHMKPWSQDNWWSLALKPTAIFLVSRQVSEEALDMFYGGSGFQVLLDHGMHHSLDIIPLGNRRRIRHIEMIGIGYWHSPPKLDEQLWLPALSGLRKLTIMVPEPPLQSYYSQKHLEDWATWLKDVLEFVNKHAPKHLVIRLDYNDTKETRELAEKCLTAGYKTVQTLWGDFFFRRGIHSRRRTVTPSEPKGSARQIE